MPPESIFLPAPWSGGSCKRARVQPQARMCVATRCPRGWQGRQMQAGEAQPALPPRFVLSAKSTKAS